MEKLAHNTISTSSKAIILNILNQLSLIIGSEQKYQRKHTMDEGQNYQVLIKKQKHESISNPEAISFILDSRITTQQAQKYIDTHQIQKVVWYQQKQKFLDVCQQAENWVIQQQKKQVAIRQAKKNINEMNKEVLKMKKSLNLHGILKDQNKQEKQQNENKAQKPQKQEKIEEESMNKQIKIEQKYQKNHNQQNKESQQQQKHLKEQIKENSTNSKVQQAKNEKNQEGIIKESKIAEEKVKDEKPQKEIQKEKFDEKPKQVTEEKDEKPKQVIEEKAKDKEPKKDIQIEKINEKPKEQIMKQKVLDEKPKEQIQKVLDEKPKNIENQVIQKQITQKQKTEEKDQKKEKQINANSIFRQEKDIQQPKEQVKSDEKEDQKQSSNKKSQQIVKQMQEQKKDQKHQQIAESHENKNEITSKNQENLDISSLQMINSSESAVIKSPIKKIKRQKKSQLPQDPFQRLKLAYNKKISKIFQSYTKLMFQPGVTFDQYEKQQQSMDLRLFLKYYKDYDLNQYYKVILVTKLFKKYAQNGIWLHEQGFFKVHEEAFNVPNLQSKQAKQSKIRRLQIIHEKIITNERVNQTLNIHENNLRMIAENRSNTLRAEMIQKLKRRRMEAELRHRIEAEKILERYQNQLNEKEIKKEITGKKSIKIDSYSKINQLKQEQKKKILQKRRKSQEKLNNPETDSKKTLTKDLSLPKLTKRKFREQNIYDTLKIIQTKHQTKNEAESLKNLIQATSKDEEEYFNTYLNQEKKIQKEQAKQASSGQQKMKFL